MLFNKVFSFQQAGSKIQLQGRQTSIKFICFSLTLIYLAYPLYNFIDDFVFFIIPLLLLTDQLFRFSIELDSRTIKIQKSFAGITYHHFEFYYQTAESCFTTFTLKNRRQTLKLEYNFWDMDEFGYTFHSKYHTIGNAKSALLLYKTLKKHFEK